MKIKRETTVEQVMQEYPQSAQIFNAANIDTCCGAHQSLEVSCKGAGLDVDKFIEMLKDMFGCGDCSTCGCEH